jgi:hypothetical protein
MFQFLVYSFGSNIIHMGKISSLEDKFRLINTGKIFSCMDKLFIPMEKIENATFYWFIHIGNKFFKKDKFRV